MESKEVLAGLGNGRSAPSGSGASFSSRDHSVEPLLLDLVFRVPLVLRVFKTSLTCRLCCQAGFSVQAL